jgi:putative Mn2+ efflux pump MntP
LGLKSLLEARNSEEAPARELSLLTVLAAAVATSLDGVAVGFGLALAQGPVGWIALSAAVATALGVTASFLLGRRIPESGRRLAQVGAGLLLVLIGASILYEHLS